MTKTSRRRPARKSPPILPAQPDRSIEELQALYLANAQDPDPAKGCYDGMTSSEISSLNRRAMFGENDIAFPSQEEWSLWVD